MLAQASRIRIQIGGVMQKAFANTRLIWGRST